MKIYAFADETGHLIDHQIEAMQRNKLDGLEIRIADGIVVSDLPAAHAKEIRKKWMMPVLQYGLSVLLLEK